MQATCLSLLADATASSSIGTVGHISTERRQIVKMEPSDTLPDSGHNYILDLVDSCKTENFETLSLNKLSVSSIN
uniref:Uncharacterized protein n=1 Tax=Trichogramma kaykai TaxID=54128 RepID=A0ABD2XGI8_9HYME